MKRFETILELGFDASHELPDCKGGHHYSVRVTHTGEPHPDLLGGTIDMTGMTSIVGIVRELDRRKLNDMLGPTYPSVHGVAGYLLERLTIFGVTKVEVSESEGYTAAVERLSG